MAQIPPQIFKGYDIRGIYPAELNEENIIPIIKAIYTFLKKNKGDENLTIVVGTDMRTSSPILVKNTIKTLISLGVDVVDIGMVSTPTFYFSVYHYGYEAGIQISASHNPKEYNGIKMVTRGPKGLIKIGKPTGLEEIKEIALSGNFKPSSGKGSVIKKTGILDDEVKNSFNIAGNPQIRKFKVVADPANAMGGQYIDALFAKLDCELIRMNFTLDGTFPAHQPDPLQQETLVDLQKKVVEEKADLGLAPDGDGDRLFFIDEKGVIIPPTIITSIVATELLKRNPNETFFVDIRYILTPKKNIEENGGKVVITKVGHSYITESMNKIGGIFAGESSAHYFFRDNGNSEAQMPVILTILKVLSESGKKLSQLAEEYQRSFESGEINFRVGNAQKIMEAVKNKHKDGELDTLDGVAVNYPSWRFSIRSSNTEPLLRLNVESYDKSEMEQKKKELVEFISKLRKPRL